MSTFNFRPAGFESDDDDEDFLFGDEDVDGKKPNVAENKHVTANSFPPKGRGGFGRAPDRPLPTITLYGDSKPGFNGAPATEKKPAPRTRPVHQRSQPPQNGPSRGQGDPAWIRSENMLIDDYRVAVMRNNTEAVQAFLGQGLAVDTVFSTRWTALMYAVQNSHPQMVQLLLDKGADVNFNKDMFTVLMAACSSTCDLEADILTCVNILLEKKVDVNAYDRYHMCALMYATKKQRATVLKRLIEAGAHMDKQDNKGYTALMYAASQGHIRCVQVLLEAGADYNKQSCDGSKAADMAYLQGHKQAEDLIRAKEDPSRNSSVPDLGVEPQTADVTRASRVSVESMLSGSKQNIYKYGDLELFLSGIELSHLIPVFQQQEVKFEDLLRMTDQTLQQLGLHQMGVRKKILDAVRDTHKKPWETSSINPVQYNKKITCAEAVAMVTNIKRHATYIGGSIGYITDQLRFSPDILVNTQDGSGSEELGIQAEEAITNVKFLFEELVSLRKHLTEVADRPEYTPPDLIKYKSTSNSNRSRSWQCKVVLAGFGMCALIYYKQDTVRDGIMSIYNKYFCQIR